MRAFACVDVQCRVGIESRTHELNRLRGRIGVGKKTGFIWFAAIGLGVHGPISACIGGRNLVEGKGETGVAVKAKSKSKKWRDMGFPLGDWMKYVVCLLMPCHYTNLS